MSTQAKKGNVVTEFLRGKKFQIQGTLFYPYLTKMKYEPNKAPKYGTMIAFDRNQNAQVVQAMEALMAQVKQQFHVNIPDHAWTNPIKDYYKSRRNDGKAHPDYLKGLMWINTSNNEKFAPQVMIVDANAQGGMRSITQMDEMQIYDGQKVVISVSFFGLHGENAKYGVSTNLDAVLIAGGGDRIMTGAGGVNVNEAFGGFLNMMGQQPPQGQQNQQYSGNHQQQPVQEQQYQNNQQYNNQGNGYQNGANSGTQQYGQQNHGGQTQGTNQGGHGHNAQTGASPSNGGPSQHPNYSQGGNNQGQQGNNQQYNNGGYNNGYNNGNGQGLV